METKVATALADGDAAHAASTLSQSLRATLGDASPGLVLVMASTAQPLEDIAKAMSAEFASAVVACVSTAGEFIESGDRKSSVSAFALAGDLRVHAGLGSGLRANPEGALRAALDGLPTEIDGYPHRTAILLVDALAGNGEEATLTAASILGPDFRLAGGAAADDLAMKRTLVALGERVEEDAAVTILVHTRTAVGLGVAHGHEEMSKAFEVTRADGPIVHEIDGRPAWDVWREAAADELRAAGVDPDAIPADREGGLLLTYEAGMRAGADLKVRAPLARTPSGALQFACELPVGSVFRFTKSTPASQVASAKLAARRAREALDGRPVAGALVFDCICRNLILGDQFASAVHGMRDELGGAPLAGFETYGEIALDAGDMSGFHNTTSVVLAFAES